MHPLKLTAPCKDYIWGGTRLKAEFGKTADFDSIAESWELSCHPDGESIISGGEYDGKKLSDYVKIAGNYTLGNNCADFGYQSDGRFTFPLLIKLIDAADNLSVQVHPNNEQAEKDGDFGKTEMWYIVDCENDSELIYGFKRRLTREEFRERIENNTLLEAVNRVKVKKSDVYFIPAGTLHAIGKDILIAEIQQSSNLTYRVYDYGRVGADGKPRQLHIDRAVEVTRLEPPPEPHNIMSCEYFSARVIDINVGAVCRADENSFNSFLVLDGEVEVCGVDGYTKTDGLTCLFEGLPRLNPFGGGNPPIRFKKGETCFIPAGYGDYTIMGRSRVIVVSV